SGDPFRLTLNGVVYVDKPPLLYWLQAGAFTTFGASEATARSVSAAAGVAAVAGTAWLGATLLGVAGGCLAGGALLTSALFFAYARYVRPDALFVAALAWGFALALVGLAEGRRRLIGWGLVAFGIAGLAKDPLGAFGPPVVILAALALAGRARPISRWLPWPGLAACLVLGLGRGSCGREPGARPPRRRGSRSRSGRWPSSASRCSRASASLTTACPSTPRWRSSRRARGVNRTRAGSA